MRIWYDTEFIEDGQTIDLISIGMVAEDGREYYAVSGEFDLKRAVTDDWLRENVVKQLPHIAEWKTRQQIRDEVLQFLLHDNKTPELWAWYAAYDHVALCQLFGKMIDLPMGLPMFTHDLRAMMSKGQASMLPKQADGVHDALEDARHLKVRWDWFMKRSA